jgi:hypothetical protein
MILTRWQLDDGHGLDLGERRAMEKDPLRNNAHHLRRSLAGERAANSMKTDDAQLDGPVDPGQHRPRRMRYWMLLLHVARCS